MATCGFYPRALSGSVPFVTEKKGPLSLPPPQPYEPHPILRWLYRRFFSHIHVDEHWIDAVSRAADGGTVVYVMRSLSWLDFLCLDFLLKRYGLPLVRFVNDLGLWILEPFGKGDRRLSLRRQLPEAPAFRKTLDEGASALLFLRRPPPFALGRRRSEQMNADLFETLVETQRKQTRPILLVPQTFVWTKLPPHHRRSVFDIFFGPSETPGRVRVFFQFLLNYRNALLRSGPPFNVLEFVEQNPNLSNLALADKVRYALFRRIERERALVLGPTKKTSLRLRAEILRSPRVQKHIGSAARVSQKSLRAVTKEADKDLRKMIAAPDPMVLGMLHRFCMWLWNRIYDGVVVDHEGIERIREAARHGTLVLLPSHKSHIDYMVLDDVLYANAMNTPLIAAGDNLNFWPIGPILRRAGAFFIRRSFRGRKLYSALVDAYIRKLIVEGFNIEFFLEGGRSRTGKLLMPKFGLLSMVVDAVLTLRNKKVFFVPIYIGYDRIIQVEEEAYEHEVGGGDKRKESFGDFLKSSRVLQSKYGRLYVEFGKILDFDELASHYKARRKKCAVAPDESRDLTPAVRRAVVQHLAYRAAYETSQVTVVTPTSLVALVLLQHDKRGMRLDNLLSASSVIIGMLNQLNARVSAPLRGSDGDVYQSAIMQALRLFVQGSMITQHGEGAEAIYQVPEERRIGLEYYKNNIVHFFVPQGLVALALLSQREERASKEQLGASVKELSRFFKYDFVFRVGVDFETALDDVLAQMIRNQEVDIVDAGYFSVPTPAASSKLVLYAGMLQSFLESYRLAFRGSGYLLRGKVSRKEWLKRVLALGQRMYLSGEIQCRESLSRPNLESALHLLKDRHMVQTDAADFLLAGAALKDASDVENAEGQIAKYLTMVPRLEQG